MAGTAPTSALASSAASTNSQQQLARPSSMSQAGGGVQRLVAEGTEGAHLQQQLGACLKQLAHMESQVGAWNNNKLLLGCCASHKESSRATVPVVAMTHIISYKHITHTCKGMHSSPTAAHPCVY